MNRVGRERLLKLAAFLETMPPEAFSFRVWVGRRDDTGLLLMMEKIPQEFASCVRRGQSPPCRTTACAVGCAPIVFPRSWMWGFSNHFGAIIPKLRKYLASSLAPEEYAARFFHISYPDAQRLFLPSVDSVVPIGRLPPQANAKQVARHIRKFVARKDKETKP